VNEKKILEWLGQFLSQLMEKKFYGHLTLTFESGKIVLIRREETLKPPS